MTHQTFAVVVAFDPDLEKLSQLCKMLSLHATVIVVDNTPGGKAQRNESICTWLENGENFGIGAAQNAGIREALRRGAKAVAFFDQDSQLTAEVLPALVEALNALGTGVVAPLCKDAAIGKEYPSFRINKLGWPVPVYIGESLELTAVDLVISSGSIASVDVFDIAGHMDESLFIDYVDFEWCARVRAAGLPIRVEPRAIMLHSIGQFSVETAGLQVFVHTPVRCYYRVRNAILLARYRHVRTMYALHEVLAAIVHHLLQFQYSENRRSHLRMGWRGLIDGLRGIRGKLELS
jgi:rhamnosyltransferase